MTDVFAFAERLMAMDDRTWRRHANPLSGWTRLLFGFPPLALAVWSRVWIGWWALPVTLLVAAWIWLNPRAFREPADFGRWMSRVVLGERIWLARARLHVPAHHATAARVTTACAGLFGLVAVWGLVVLDASAVILGGAASMLSKAWFCDRMVWLHADLTGIPPGTPMPEPTLPPDMESAS